MSLFSGDSTKNVAKGGGGAKGGGMAVILQFDGGSRGNPGPAGIGVTLSDESGDVLYELGEFLGTCTNNVAEYTALVRGLSAAKTLGARKVTVRADSELVVRQINGIYKVKSPDLKPLYQRAVALIEEIGNVKVVHVYREGNTRADELANEAMDEGRKIEPLGPVGGWAVPAGAGGVGGAGGAGRGKPLKKTLIRRRCQRR